MTIQFNGIGQMSSGDFVFTEGAAVDVPNDFGKYLLETFKDLFEEVKSSKTEKTGKQL